MKVMTRGGKKTIDFLIPSEVEIVVERDEDEVEVTTQSKNAIEKEVKITPKSCSCSNTPTSIPTKVGSTKKENATGLLLC